MGKTTFKKSLEKDYPWLQAVLDDTFAAFCKQCCKKFKIDGSGVLQVRSHAKARKEPLDLNKRPFNIVGSSEVLEPKICLVLILQSLHCTHQNYSFASVSSDNQRFRLMFPGSEIAENYQQSETKIKCSIQYGIAPYLKQKLIYNI